MKIAIIYKSKSGFTLKYAEFLAEAIKGDLIEAKDASINELKKYDVIVYGGGLYIGGINGVKLITRNIDKLKDSKIIIFATGAAPGRENEIKEIIEGNFTEELLKTIKFFYLRGGYDFSKLTFIDKVLMTMLKLKLKYKKNLTPDERGILTAYNQPVDFVSEENIDPVLEYIKR